MSNPNVTVHVGGTGPDVGLHLGGGLAVDGDLLDKIGVTVNGPLPVITLAPLKVDVGVNLAKIVTDSTVALDLKVAVTELPKIRLEFGFAPMRMHFPTHYQMCFSLFGKEVFKFALCGESMIACEHYLPHQTEKCG